MVVILTPIVLMVVGIPGEYALDIQANTGGSVFDPPNIS